MAIVNLVQKKEESNGFGSKLDLDGETRLMMGAVEALRDLLKVKKFSPYSVNDDDIERTIPLPTHIKARDVGRILDDIDQFLTKVEMVSRNEQTYRITAESLIEDARNNFSGISKKIPLEEYITHLPAALEEILYDEIKSLGDRKSILKTSIGKPLRALAALIVSLQDKLAETENNSIKD